jgi:DNA-binding MarR family transcriptional regulator
VEDRFEQFTLSIARLYKLIGEVKTQRMEQFGLKGVHALCLFQLLGSPQGRTPAELSEAGDIDRAQVSRVLSALTEAGMVRRDGDPGRYRVRYVLTDSGREIAEEVRELVINIQEYVDHGVDPEDLKAFYRVIGKLTENFEELANNQK